jgi:glucose-6-phosphate-specific signal transduction histidine kinase
LFFAPRRGGAAASRYRKLSRRLEAWLPPGWSVAEQVLDERERRRVWIARDWQTHTLLTLTLTATQVYLLVKRLPT